MEAVAIFFAESRYFDDEKAQAKVRAETRISEAAKKAEERELGKRKRGPKAGAIGPVVKRTRRNSDAVIASGSGSGLGLSETRAEQTPPVAMSTPAAMSDFEALRVTFSQARKVLKQGHASGSGKSKKKAADMIEELDPELDNLINAATRIIQCYRKVITAYYDNDRVGKVL